MWSTRGVGVTIFLFISVGLVSTRSPRHTPILHGHHGCRCVTQEECGDGGGFIKPRVNVTRSDCDEGETYCCVILETPPPPPPPPKLRCGTHEPVHAPGFSFGFGGVALRNEFPWLVKILDKDRRYMGSGVLIDESRVLTVAHLFQNSKAGSVVLGIHAKVELVAETQTHKHFNDVNLHNDIAILHLAKKLNLRSLYPEVGTVCLPQEQFNGGESCVLSTFGEDNHPFIRKMEMSILSGNACQDKLRKTGKVGSGFLLDRSFLCAGGPLSDGTWGQDACEGHGGSPLVCKGEDERYTVAGLVSWGLTKGDCSDRGKYPGAYLNVAKYRDWIEQNQNKWCES